MAQDGLNLVDAVTQLGFLVHGVLAAHADEHGLSIVQVRLLGVLRDRTPTMNDLARLLELDKSSVTGLVARAEKRGLVIRAPSSSDGRSTVVMPTESGRRLIRTVSARFSADLEGMAGVLTAAERVVLARLAGRVVTQHARKRGLDLSEHSSQHRELGVTWV